MISYSLKWIGLSTVAIGWALLPSAQAAVPTENARPEAKALDESKLNLLLVEVNLGQDRLTDILNVYELGDDILLPIGEIAQLLTIGITVDPATRTASGFLLREDQAFRVDPASATAVVADRRESFDGSLARWIDGDLYVARRLLQSWWPVDFSLDIAALRLNVRPREKLPLQARMERERIQRRSTKGGASAPTDPLYPYFRAHYGWLSVPFIDNTVSLDLRGTDGQVSTNAAYSGFLTGDLLGMEAAGFLSFSKAKPEPEARLTLARHDPDAGLLGPLNARSVMLGSIGVPAFENVLRGTGVGNGILISNRPLNLPSSYRSQTLRGDLPPGWDVTVYFNDALIAFQQARGDGRYEFPDLPLAYGKNEFRLVFIGPLGQTRVERQAFELDQTLTAPGDLFYTVAAQHDNNGATRQTLQLDYGAFEDVGITLGGVYIDDEPSSPGRVYANAGARLSVLGAMINVDHVRQAKGGSLTEVGVRTSLASVSIDATRVWVKNFRSEFFDRRSDPVTSRDRLRLAGTLGLGTLRLPMALDVERESYASGDETLDVQQRFSVNLRGTSVTNMLHWRSSDGSDRVGGVLQLSRRVAGVGISGQAVYSVAPPATINSLAVSADKTLGDSNRINIGLLHNFDTKSSVATAGLNRNFGSFGLGLSARFGGRSNYGVGLQLFTAIGRNPQSGRLLSDWRPMAASGTAAARVFIDDNRNGRFDASEDPVEGVGFKINGGSRHPVRTNAAGIALIHRLAPRDYLDLGLDVGTVEDAQLQAAVPGVRLLPRPGRAQLIEFPLIMTGEIDGTIYLVEKGKPRAIGNALVELISERGDIVGSTRSASDGFYVMPGVRPGEYRVRISPKQTGELALTADGEVRVKMPGDPDFINGIDLTLHKRAPCTAGIEPVSAISKCVPR